MRIFEIILKVLFLLGSVYAIKAEMVASPFLVTYLTITFILGIVLIFNKKTSYKFAQTNKDFIMRRVEGLLLVIFAMFVYFAQVFPY